MALYILLVDTVMFGLFVLRYNHLPPQIPLLYSKQWGEDQLVDWWWIFLLPILLTLYFFVNEWLYRTYFVHNPLVKKIIHYFNVFLLCTYTTIFIRILFLIT